MEKIAILLIPFFLIGCGSNKTTTSIRRKTGSDSNTSVSETVSTSESPQNKDEFGVFLGLDCFDNKLLNYRNVAIEIEEFDSSELAKLKDNNTKIYAYLSVGSLEKYRPYYNDFKDCTFAPYENWEDEEWMDVSNKSWQNKMNELATNFKILGADGLFLDNFDVYYYASEVSEEFANKIYDGCQTILKSLEELNMSLMINSGTDFLEKMDENSDSLLNKIDWYAQESVFSKIEDYEKDLFSKQDKEETDYYIEMIKMMKEYSKVLLIEYTKDDGLIDDIKSYCSSNNLYCFISNSVKLI